MMTEQNHPKALTALIDSIEAMESYSVSKVRQVLMASEITAADLANWYRFDHPKADSYGRAMIYHGGFFEVMVMSWNPGHISAIHDHGHTQWGAVKVFGQAEHAAYLVQNEAMQTLARTVVPAGTVMGVGHELVHQMGCPANAAPFVSLHVYGCYDKKEHITGNARVFNLALNRIEIANGGAFYNLPDKEIANLLPCPEPNFEAWLRDTVELIRVKQRCGLEGETLQRFVSEHLSTTKHFSQFLEYLQESTSTDGHFIDSNQWEILNSALYHAARLQDDLEGDTNKGDNFNTYAAVYNKVVGEPCLSSFIANYIRFVANKYAFNLQEQQMLSIGCGTGLVEQFMVRELNIPHNNIYGMDLSAAMVDEARKHIKADVGNALELDPAVKQWDLAYCGLNVLQYIGHEQFATAIERVAGILKPGGQFFGDFITSDHIRKYPNVFYSTDRQIASFRTPRLIEKDNYMYQRSRLFNLNTTTGEMRITYEGEHDRFLAPMSRVIASFEQHFSEVDLYDALSLEKINTAKDTCPSTRYVVVARK